MNELLWLLLPIAAASGWLAARRSVGKPKPLNQDKTPAYFRGLNYLLNEQPDKAIDVFVKMLEVDSDTVETHLALGNLFRRRGEVDRAIRIHQNLIARPTLERDQRAQALLELGQDYMRAGLFDRAESLFQELGDMKMYQEQALQNLRVIYQQEKDWTRCLEVARELEQLSGESLSVERSHYYCELAQEAIGHGDTALAAANLKKARASDSNCVRATLLQGELEIAAGDCRAAIRTLQQVEQQDSAYLSEALPGLQECFDRAGSRRELIDYLRQLSDRDSGIAPVLALVDLMRVEQGDQTALEFLSDYLQTNPDLVGLDRLIELNTAAEGAAHARTLSIIRELIGKMLQERPAYQCSQCGFGAKTLHWQCPGCKSWSSIKPVHGMG